MQHLVHDASYGIVSNDNSFLHLTANGTALHNQYENVQQSPVPRTFADTPVIRTTIAKNYVEEKRGKKHTEHAINKLYLTGDRFTAITLNVSSSSM